MPSKKKYFILAGGTALIIAFSVYLAAKPPSGAAPGKTSDVFGTSDVKEGTASNPLVQNGVYKNEKFSFSVAIPDDLKVTETNPDEFTTMVLAEAADARLDSSARQASQQRSFQIFIMPFDEPGPITKERILIDLPEATVDNPQPVSINGIDALLFFGKDEDLGKTREVWFAHEGYLYQVSSYASFDEELSKIMTSFKFQE